VEDIQSIPILVARLAQLQDNYLRLTEDWYAYDSQEGWEDPAKDVDIYEAKHYATYATLSNKLEDLKAVLIATQYSSCFRSITQHYSQKPFGLSVRANQAPNLFRKL